ncbi:MAG TPA: DUF6178 family protein [Polyangiales bacterium]|nr:DUF6178 family protein [Polyangiales bacterium]
MSRLVRSHAGPQSATRLLARILERPELVAVVDKLSAPVLGQLIEHVGLEDAGELVAAATTQQLARVWDRDLWSRPEQGGAERFDPERFALWLAVMLEAGEAQTVARLRELPIDLLTLAVHRLVRVVERAWLDVIEEHSDDDDEGEGGPHTPWHELVLIARDEHAWDSVLTALLALDEEDHALLRRVLERCRDMDAQLADLALEPDQIYTALTHDAALESDLAAERDTKQSASGYLSSADAQGFLRLARMPFAGRASQLNRDPIANAYFRELATITAPEASGSVSEDDARDSPSSQGPEHARHAPDSADGQGASHEGEAGSQALSVAERSALASLLDVLVESGVLADQPKAIAALPANAEAPAPELDETLLQAALRLLERDHPALWSERMEELGFLANAVLAGGRDGGLVFDPRGALEASTALCSLGLELELRPAQRTSVAAAADLLLRVPADRLFRTGSARTHGELTLPARRALLLRCERHAPAHIDQLRAALSHDELDAWPEAVGAELLRLKPERWEALRALCESFPRIGAGGSARFLATHLQLNSAKRLIRSATPRAPRQS